VWCSWAWLIKVLQWFSKLSWYSLICRDKFLRLLRWLRSDRGRTSFISPDRIKFSEAIFWQLFNKLPKEHCCAPSKKKIFFDCRWRSRLDIWKGSYEGSKKFDSVKLIPRKSVWAKAAKLIFRRFLSEVMIRKSEAMFLVLRFSNGIFSRILLSEM